MAEEQFKIVIDCPLCEKKELQVVTDNDVTFRQCIGCGYSTSDKYKVADDNEVIKNLSEDMKRWSKTVDDMVWIPSILTLGTGMYYPYPNENDESFKWAYTPLVKIPKDEQEKYPNPAGGYYEQRYDIENQLYFDNFDEGLLEIEKLVGSGS